MSALRRWLDDAAGDIGWTIRAFAKNLPLPIVAILTLATGVGGTTAVFSLARALLFSDLGLPATRDLVTIQEQRSGSVFMMNGFVALPMDRIVEYRERTAEVFGGIAAHRSTDLALATESGSRAVVGTRTTGNFFDLLQLRPQLGRFYTADDEPAVVISHAIWQSMFGADPDAVGRTLRLNGRPYEVAGVAPRGFSGLMVGFAADVWVPVRAHASDNDPDPWLLPFARLVPGTDRLRAQAIVDAAARAIAAPPPTVVRSATIQPLDGLPPTGRSMAFGFMGLLLGMAALVLCISSANIAGLLLTRGAARRRELAVRLALGASRVRVVRQLLTETLVLFLIGGAAGLVVAWGATRFLGALRLPGPLRLDEQLTPDLIVLAFGLASALVAGVVFGLAPALQATSPDLLAALREGIGQARRQSRLRSGFVAGQVMMAVILLITTGLFVRTVFRALTRDVAFDDRSVVIARVDLEPHGYDETRARAFLAEWANRVRAVPGVEDAALSSIVLLTGDRSGNNIHAVEPDRPADDPGVSGAHAIVDHHYFETMRVPLVAGRPFSESDRVGTEPVVVINQTLAERLWPDSDPIGRAIRTGGVTYTVIGLSRDGKYSHMQEPPTPFVFHAHGQEPAASMALHVRTTRPMETLQAMSDAVRAIDPDVALFDAAPLHHLTGISILAQRFSAWVVGVFGVLGLLLAGLGIYGVLAAFVAQRYREIGIRIAIGAPAREVIRLVVSRAARLAMLGAFLGVGLALALSRYLQVLLIDVSPRDPLTFLTVPLLLASVAVLACWLPARRATRIDPIRALRAE
ncbi:MAG: ABC transporter permease [Gemmatimonadetes bacterium]|nr:ABC transporter permease [Gemmatimonadota bacterium]